jgi:hypothetical protein
MARATNLIDNFPPRFYLTRNAAEQLVQRYRRFISSPNYAAQAAALQIMAERQGDGNEQL